MNFLDMAKMRYSVRNYQEKRVDREKLNTILEAGRVAPTAANMQPQRILVVESADGLAKLSKATKTFNAPLALIICADKENVWVRPQDGKKTYDIDASIITDHMMLQATELGLGTLWMTWFDPAVVKKEFDLPSNYEPVNILLLGYAGGNPQPPERHNQARKPIGETVFFEKF